MKEALCRKTAGKGRNVPLFLRKKGNVQLVFLSTSGISRPVIRGANDLSKSANKVHLKYPSDLFPFLNNYFSFPSLRCSRTTTCSRFVDSWGWRQSWCGHSSTLNATTLCRSATSARRRGLSSVRAQVHAREPHTLNKQHKQFLISLRRRERLSS